MTFKGKVFSLQILKGHNQMLCVCCTAKIWFQKVKIWLSNRKVKLTRARIFFIAILLLFILFWLHPPPFTPSPSNIFVSILELKLKLPIEKSLHFTFSVLHIFSNYIWFAALSGSILTTDNWFLVSLKISFTLYPLHMLNRKEKSLAR